MHVAEHAQGQMTRGTSVEDRQRDRATRGIRSRTPLPGADRPSPPRRRRPLLVALALVLIVGGAATAGLLAVRLDAREPYIVLASDVPVGAEITQDMLATTSASGDGLLAVPASEKDAVLGTYARVPLSKGQLLDTTMVVKNEPFGDDVALVGVPLAQGRVPVGLRTGDEVRIVRTGDGSAPPQALAVGLVIDTTAPDEDGGLTGGSSGSVAMLMVPIGAADLIVDAAGADLAGLSLMRRGVAVDDADLVVFGGGA